MMVSCCLNAAALAVMAWPRLACAAYCDHVLIDEGKPCEYPDSGKQKTDVPNPMVVPRFSGIATFLKLPMATEGTKYDIAVLGIPFDGGASYRAGARFGPGGVRHASKKLRASGYQPGLRMHPFQDVTVVDVGDAPVTPYDIATAMDQATDFVMSVTKDKGPAGLPQRAVMIGGDHLVPVATLRALRRSSQPSGVCLIHFDAHMDTSEDFFGEKYTHGTPFRRASDEGLLRPDCSISVGLRGGLSGVSDWSEHRRLGFDIVTADDVTDLGFPATLHRMRQRVGNQPTYVTVDIDVLDPAFAPGTGTLDPGGLSSRELLRLLRGLVGLNVVGGDVVEVSPPYDHMEITQLNAAYVALDLIGLLSNAITSPDHHTEL